MGGRRALDREELGRILPSAASGQSTIALGEPAKGIVGWRLTHRQARAALLIAMRERRRLVSYAEVAVLASILADDLLLASLHQIYLAPLATLRDGGEVLRKSLRAYFRADRNVTAAAAALGVTRQALAKRLAQVEERVARRLSDCSVELELALRIEALETERKSPQSIPGNPQLFAPLQHHIAM